MATGLSPFSHQVPVLSLILRKSLHSAGSVAVVQHKASNRRSGLSPLDCEGVCGCSDQWKMMEVASKAGYKRTVYQNACSYTSESSDHKPDYPGATMLGGNPNHTKKPQVDILLGTPLRPISMTPQHSPGARHMGRSLHMTPVT